MNTFSDELRKIREEKNISLNDIAKKTRIDLKHFEAIERGTFNIVPQAYIRAFLKAYAQEVGVSPEEVLKKYDIMVVGKYTSAQITETEKQTPQETTATLTKEIHKNQKKKKIIVVVASITVVVIIAYFIYNNRNTDTSIRETPFTEVIKEHEQRVSTIDSTKIKDTTKTLTTLTPMATIDSLTLRGIALDTVWLSIRIDSNALKEYLLFPTERREWKGKNEFLLTLGSAGSIEFTLNEKKMNLFGKKGRVLRNISITAKNLENN